MRRKWISNSVVDEWNGLSNHIVSSETMVRLKIRLDKFMDEDDSWNWAAVLTQGLPLVELMASCSFPHILIFLISLLEITLHQL